MDILIVGGTRFMGVHLTKNLLKSHKITIANRGIIPDSFGDSLERIKFDRNDEESIKAAFSGKKFDIVYDCIAYSSIDVKNLLDIISCEKYIQISSISVYKDIYENIREEAFNPHEYNLKYCTSKDFAYDEIKRQAETAIFQIYEKFKPVSIRFPYVIGTDDYTKRFSFYIQHIMKSIPMFIDNLDERIAFVSSKEAADFMAYLSKSDFCGQINAASYGNISIRKIIEYAEKKSGKKAIVSKDGENAPYNSAPTFSLDLRKSEEIGFKFSELNSWIYDLIDELILFSFR